MWRKLTWLLSRESWGRQPEVSQSLHVPGCPGLQQLWENRHKMSNSREPTGKAQAEGLEAYEELDEMARQRQANQATHVGGWAQKGCYLRVTLTANWTKFPGTYFGCKVSGWVVGLGPVIGEGSAWGF